MDNIIIGVTATDADGQAAGTGVGDCCR